MAAHAEPLLHHLKRLLGQADTDSCDDAALLRLILLLTLGLAGGAGVLAFPLPNAIQIEEKQATQAKSPEQKTETPKPASDKAEPTDLYGDPLPAGAIARLGTVRFRHGGFLGDALLSPDGRTLFSAGDESIEWWDARSGRRQRRIALPSPNHRVAGIDLSPDGKLLALSFQVGSKVRFWDTASGTEVYPFGDDAPKFGRAKFSPNGELLAKFDFGNQLTVSIWDIRRRKNIRTIEGGDRLSSAFRSLAFSPDGKLLAFPHKNGVRVWDLAADKELYQLDVGAKRSMGCVVFSTDNNLLAAAMSPIINFPVEADHSIHLWDMATGKEVGALKGHEWLITALAISPKGNLLASASLDRTIRFWDLTKLQEIGRSPIPIRSCRALSFSADGSVLASAEPNGLLRLLDMRKHEEIATPSAGANCVEWVRFAPDGQTLISTAAEQIGLWEPLTGQPRRLFQCAHLIASPLLRSVALSPDGKSLATMSDRNQGRAFLWDVATGKLMRRFSANAGAIAFSPDGRRVVGASYAEGTIHVWDTASGKELLQLRGQKYTHALAFAPDGATLAATSGWANTDMTVRMWKLATGEEIWRKSTRPWLAFDLQFSPDGNTLAAVGAAMPGQSNAPGEFHLWDSATGKELKQFEGNRSAVRRVAFSSDGRMLATGSDDNTVRLWEVASGKERQCFQGHQRTILSVSFSPDDRLLASASADTTALVWDLTGRFRNGRFQERHLSAEELKRCWDDLAHADAVRAYRSIVALTGSPKEAVPFLQHRLPSLTLADPKRVAPLLAALDSDQFAERDKAMTELEELGLAVEPALRTALNAKPSLEVRRRMETILDKLAAGPRLRFLRAIEILENIATPEAHRLLETLSQGSTDLLPTHEAKASMRRLKLRSSPNP